MSYLVTQMFLYMLCTFLLGLLLGWLFWRKGVSDTAEIDALTTGRNALRKERDDLNGALEACRARTQQALDEVRALTAANADLQSRIAAPVMAAPAMAAPLMAAPVAAKPQGLSAPRGGQPDNLQDIVGVGPALEKLLFDLGYFHFDQIAKWTQAEINWVDDNLEGFKGRVTRDNWVAQAQDFARR
jgi:predicted flap endonuclease-1-like 5' DNA nuclease